MFDKIKEEFKNYISLKNYSERTINCYLQEITHFFRFIEKYYPRIGELFEINKEIIKDYSNYLMTYKTKENKLLCSKTQKLKLTVLKIFFNFLINEDYIIKNPAGSIILPREEKSIPRNILTPKEIELILNSIDIRTPIGLRNKTLIEVLFSCGIRTTEACDLKIKDINFDEQSLIVEKGKGRKTRLIPLTQYAVEILRSYLENGRKHFIRGKKIQDEGYLFISNKGKKFTRNTINKCIMQPISKNAKLDKKITVYTFRHSLATALVKSKIDIRFIQVLLGHSSIKTTEKYTHLNITDIKKMHSLYHPREIDNNSK